MIHGETTRRPNASCTATATTYSEATQSHIGQIPSSPVLVTVTGAWPFGLARPSRASSGAS